jgi:prevent-host-death family protein
MREVGVTEAKKRWSELLWLAASGEEIAITNRGRVIARLVPPLPALDRHQARLAAVRIRERRRGVTLGKLSIKEVIAAGRVT